MDIDELSEFAKRVTEHCPTEARNYFEEILNKLEKIENRITLIEEKLENKQT